MVLVHGVGMGAGAFSACAHQLAEDHRVLVPDRRGYGASRDLPLSASFDEQVEDLIALVRAEAGGPVIVAGVSGGATLCLAMTLAAPGLVTAAVLHEPAVGPVAPELYARLARAAAALADTPGPEAAVALIAGLVAERSWSRFSPVWGGQVAACAGAVRHEVPQFVGFAPTRSALAAARSVRLVTTVGSRSPGYRGRAAVILAGATGATVAILRGARHVPHLEAPVLFADTIRRATVAAG